MQVPAEKITVQKSGGLKNGKYGTRCGIAGWSPQWLQGFNNMSVFIVCYVALSVIYGMASSYTSSMIPSIEKRFGFSSKATGTFLAMNDVAHVILAIFTAHFGGAGHRPRWISLGCFLLGASLLLQATPEILFPAPNLHGLSRAVSGSADTELLCSEKRAAAFNTTGALVGKCVDTGDRKLGPLAVMSVAHFLLGVGSTTLIVLGLPFIDDNSDKKNIPIYFAISFSGRIFGPMLGFALGAFCNTIFLDWSDPGFSQTDPRWISAWYLGFLITGMGLCVFALTMGCFPASIPKPIKKSKSDMDMEVKPPLKDEEQSKDLVETSEKEVSWQDLPRNMKRLLVNGAFMCGALSRMLEGLIIAGYMSFLPKFIGQQFQISPSEASLAGGVPTVFAVAFGVICGGILIRRFKPEPRHIGIGMTAAALIMAGAFYGATKLGCEKTTIYGFGSARQSRAERSQLFAQNASCPSAQSCGCPETEFRPVCDPETGINYYSACHAGCRSATQINKTKRYHECACVHPNIVGNHTSGFEPQPVSSLVEGLCPKKCSNFSIFISMLFFALFIIGLPLSGGMMIQFRVVDQDLKALATGFTALLMSAFGFLPAPILAGALVDSSCKLWQVKDCGAKGFCLVYDTDELRWKLHLAAGTIKIIIAVFDALMTYKVWTFKFDREADGVLPGSAMSSIKPAAALAVMDTFAHDAIVPAAVDDRLNRMLADDVDSASKV